MTSSFVSPLVVKLGDGRRWKLYLSFTFHLGSKYSKDCIRVPAGFLTDFASIPKFLWWLPYWAKYHKGAVLHDYLYQHQQIMGEAITRRKADDIFLEAMLIDFRKNGFRGKLIAVTEYIAVRLWGFLAWRS